MPARVLVVGGGGREHALAWHLLRSPSVGQVFVAPGNGGTAARCTNVAIAAADVDALLAFATAERIDLTIVGPEAPLVAGIVDRFSAAGLRCFGPSQATAQLEGSKAFSKAFMDRQGVPTARWRSFTEVSAALAWLDAASFDVVVKASGLAAGKGVIMCASKDEAREATQQMFAGAFGDAGAEVVLEENLQGEETSLIAFCDGETIVAMPAAQDHKRVGERDTGPNTGGMGAYAPAPVAAHRQDELVAATLAPIVEGFAAEGTPFRGMLYAGIMMTSAGPRVLEYNVRFGDPEAQVLLPLLDADFYEVASAAVDGRLHEAAVSTAPGVAATVVAASGGYPGPYDKGVPIHGTDAADALEGVTVFHAGTALAGDQLVTSGGRVLAVTGVGPSLKEALGRAYAGIDEIRFEGMHMRRDIGWRAL